jgi:hypothetical protein
MRFDKVAIAFLGMLIFVGSVFSAEPQISFKDLVISAESNFKQIHQARSLALDLGQPTTIYLAEGVMIDVLAVEEGVPVYAVITNLAHPFDGGYTAFFDKVRNQFDLSDARIHYGTKKVINPELGFPDERDVAPGDSLLLIPDWSNDRVMAFDYATGDLFDTDFVPSSSTLLSSPKEAQVSPWGTISVSDQIEDVVQEFDTSGSYIRIFAPAGGVNNDILDNIRGHAYRPNGNLVVTVGQGTNDDAVAEFDSAGNYLGNFIANGSGGLLGPFGIWFRANDVLVSGSDSDALHRYDLNGNYLENLVSINSFPQQVIELPDNNIAVANFSGITGSGVLIYSPTGQFIRLLSGVTGNRGVWQLGNGNILTTNGSGVHELDPVSGTLLRTVVSGVSAQYINLYVPAQPPANSVVILTAKIGGDSQYRSFWVNGSWDANGVYDPNWTGPMVELNDNGVGPDAVAGDTYFTGSVILSIDNTNTYNWWTGSEDDINSFLEDGVGFDVLSTDTVYADTLIVDGDGGINEWVIALAGDHNGWNNTDDMTRNGTVWEKEVQLTAGTYAYKYAVMHQWSAAYGNGGVGGAGSNYSFNATQNGTYLFEFDDSDNSQSVTLVVGIEGGSRQIPDRFDISANYPNPFNPTTTLKYQIPRTSEVAITIYNNLGQVVRTLVSKKQEPGYYEAIWNGTNDNGQLLPSGIYIYQIRAGNFVKSGKMILLK